mmetsp:Transcript_20336/g.34882  ORF Transcript_20336/g.34882 Transcript_20336/m.34882 type:complete len:274 (+) Transcript_20336:438-1259(+)
MSALSSGFSAAPPRPAKTPPRPASWRHLLCFCLNSTSACECVPAFGPAHWRPFSSPKPQVWPNFCGSSFSAIFSCFSKNSTSACECVPAIGFAHWRPFSSPKPQVWPNFCGSSFSAIFSCFSKNSTSACECVPAFGPAHWRPFSSPKPQVWPYICGSSLSAIFSSFSKNSTSACECVPVIGSERKRPFSSPNAQVLSICEPVLGDFDQKELDARRSVASFFNCSTSPISLICCAVCILRAWPAQDKQAAANTIERMFVVMYMKKVHSEAQSKF